MSTSNSPTDRLTALEIHRQADKEWRERTDRTLDKIADAMQKMTSIEMQNRTQAKQLDDITRDVQAIDDDLSARIKIIEDKLPALEITSQGSMGVFKLVATAFITALITAGGLMLKGS